MRTHQHWRLSLNRDDDKPRLGNGLVVYSAQGSPAFYSLVTKRRVVLSRRAQDLFHGVYLVGQLYPYPSGGGLATVINNDARTTYNLAIFQTPDADPLQDLLTCPASS